MSTEFQRGGCTCEPSEGFHQYRCSLSREMRAKQADGDRPHVPPDPRERARV